MRSRAAFGISRRTIATSQGLEAGYGGRRCLLCEEFGLTDGLRSKIRAIGHRADPTKIGQELFRSLEASTVHGGRREGSDPNPTIPEDQTESILQK